MIKNIEDLKNIQVVCRNDKDIEKYFKILKELGFEVVLYNGYKVFYYSTFLEKFSNRMEVDCYLETYFFNKKLIKTLQKFIKEKEEKGQVKEEEKVKDFEVAEDGRITKVNDYNSDKTIFIFPCDFNKGTMFCAYSQDYIDNFINCGLAFATKEARDRAEFKMKIETQLKNIAERLNAGRNIDWKNALPHKYFIYYIQNKENQSEEKILLGYDFKFKRQGAIYCLDENFLDVAKKEIGELNLIKYFKE